MELNFYSFLIIGIIITIVFIVSFNMGYKLRKVDEKQTIKKGIETKSFKISDHTRKDYKPKPDCECKDISDCTGFGSIGCMIK